MTEKKQLTNKGRLAIVLGIVVLLLVITGGMVFTLWSRGMNSPEKTPGLVEKLIEYFKQTVYAKEEPKDLGNPNKDVGVMILDCDSTDVFETMEGIKVCNMDGRYVQGTGSFGRLKSNNVLGRGVLKDPVDISAYRNGSIHISVYVDDVSKMQRELWLELSSSGTHDKEEMSFCIPRTEMENGWNEFYLSISDARKNGEPNLKSINFIRMTESNYMYGPKILYDNIYATNTPGVRYNSIPPRLKPDGYDETQTTRGKMIMSCNTVNILEGMIEAKVVTDASKHVEGSGAFKLNISPKNTASSFLLKKPVDISAYKNGSIHVSFYVNDPKQLPAGLTIELSSAGTFDKAEYELSIDAKKFSAGWNHFWLELASARTKGNPDLSKINFIRVWASKPGDKLELIMDDLYATMDREQDPYAETSSDKGKMIASCNTTNIFQKVEKAAVTTKEGQFVEGTGAFKSESHKSILMMKGILLNSVDISEYKDGFIHMSFYINKASFLKDNVSLEISSYGGNDKDDNLLRFVVSKDDLKNGWNELYFKLAKPNGKKGICDLSAIKKIRVFGNRAEGAMTIIDDICVTSTEHDGYEETSSNKGKMISSCNTISIFQKLEQTRVTVAKDMFVEGTGAFRTDGNKSVLMMKGILDKSVDISEYKDGYIHMSFYIRNKNHLTDSADGKAKAGVYLEISSYGGDDKDEDFLRWSVFKDELKNGWNDLYFKLSSAGKKGDCDLSAIKKIRVFGHRTEEAVTVIDDICVTQKIYDTYKETTTDAGKMIASCNTVNIFKTLERVSVVTAQGEFVEGTGALKSEGHTSIVVMRGILEKTVDISKYSEGYIHVSFYINNTSLLGEYVNLELSSSDKDDTDEYEWRIATKELQNGWNECFLKISERSSTKGSINFSAIKRIRIYSAGRQADAVTIVDNIYATLKKAATEEKDYNWGPIF